MKKSSMAAGCDAINFIGAAAFTLLLAADIIKYALTGSLYAFAAAAAADVIFLLAAWTVYALRLPPLWFAVCAGSTVFLACTSFFPTPINVIKLLMAIFSLLAGTAGLILFIAKKQRPRAAGLKIMAITLTVAVAGGIIWGGEVMTANAKTGAAQREIMGVPDKYTAICSEGGRVEELVYTTKAYATDQREVQKTALVYLPYDYDSQKQYDILYLLHGTGDDYNYWFRTNPVNKNIVDNLIYYGDISPLIIVTPTWYTQNDCADSPDELTYAFLYEFRNDLIAAVESRYSTFSAGRTDSQALTDSRDHRAFAGLSRGAATTFRAAFNHCLDYVSWFGAFSGCMTDASQFEKGALSEENRKYKINYLYNTSGGFDFLLGEHLESYKWLLANDVRLTENLNCSFDVFPMCRHSAESWTIALYNCLQIFFK